MDEEGKIRKHRDWASLDESSTRTEIVEKIRSFRSKGVDFLDALKRAIEVVIPLTQ